MLKKTVVLVLIVCLFGTLLCACGGEKITSEQAYQIVLDDLGSLASKVSGPHIHEGTYGGRPCFNIYVTVEGLGGMQYVISDTGDIISKGPGGHSH